MRRSFWSCLINRIVIAHLTYVCSIGSQSKSGKTDAYDSLVVRGSGCIYCFDLSSNIALIHLPRGPYVVIQSRYSTRLGKYPLYPSISFSPSEPTASYV